MLKWKKKKIKLLLIGGVLLFLLSILMIAAIMAAVTAALAGGVSDAKKMKTDDYENAIECFRILGEEKTDNTFLLDFVFDNWKIENIKMSINGTSGNIVKTVKMPSFEGDNAAIIYQYLRRAGYTHEGACGILGCLWAESNSFNPCEVEKDNFWTQGNALKAGYGICQWTNTTPPYTSGRRSKVIDWLRKNGYEPFKNSKKLLLGQLKYMLLEKGYDKARNLCKKETDIALATEYWLKYYEGAYNVPYYTKRLDKAKEFNNTFKNFEPAKEGKYVNAKLEINYVKSGTSISFEGKLDGVDIAGSFAKDSKIEGVGFYGEGARDVNGIDGILFLGADDTVTAKSRKIIASVRKWQNPYAQGYAHLCEGWVTRVYSDAKINYVGSCCAAASRDKYAKNDGKIPVGAAIYSGNTYHSAVICGCGRNAGHVAIYIGNNVVAGSQPTYKMSLKSWKAVFGYGGWYMP